MLRNNFVDLIYSVRGMYYVECTPNEGIKLLIDDSDCDIFDHCMILCEDIDC